MNGFRCVAAVLALALAACGDGSVQSPAFTPVLKDIRISPETSTPDPLPVGRTVEFVAEGRFSLPPPATAEELSDWQELDDASWTSETEAVATIDGDGIARGISPGTTQITAEASGLESAAVILTVVPPVLDSIVIVDAADTSANPPPIESATIPLGASQGYEALGVYSDDAVPRPVEGVVIWTSSDSTIASVTPPVGATTNASGEAEGGPVTITATSGGISDTTQLTVTNAALASFDRIDPPTAIVAPGLARTFTAIGTFTDSPEPRPIDNALLDWTSDPTTVATVEADGQATGVANGIATITATLKPDQFAGVVPRSRSAQLTVTDAACTTPLLESAGATIENAAFGICLLCNTQDLGNVIDDDQDNFATMNVPVGLLNAGESVTIHTAAGSTPFPAGQMPGFVVGRPAGQLLLAELFSQIEVSTLLGNTVQETSGAVTPLRLDLLGIKLIPNSDIALATLTATLPYDGIRLSLKSGTATALSSLQVFNGCGTTQPPESAELTGLSRLEPADAVIEVDSGQYYAAVGSFVGDLEGAVQSSELNWSTGNAAVATIDAMGFLQGVAPGETTVTATLKSDPTKTVATGVSIVQPVCESQLLASQEASVSTEKNGLCLLCSVANEDAVIDDFNSNFATIALNLAALGGSAGITVQSNADTPFPVGSTAGFLVGRPLGKALAAELLSQLQIDLLDEDGDVVQSSTSVTTPLLLDLLGINLTSNDQTAIATMTSAVPYTGVRLNFNAGVASALTSVNVYQACSDTNVPETTP